MAPPPQMADCKGRQNGFFKEKGDFLRSTNFKLLSEIIINSLKKCDF